ncbi:hypothetical protein STEG23_024114, partial [Scotinomys teguina]
MCSAAYGAYTLSALALSVRISERQREQQTYMVELLQDAMGQHPAAPRVSVSEVCQLHQQREEAVTQLHSTQVALHKAMRECDMLRRRLYHAERSAQMSTLIPNIVTRPHIQHLGASVLPLNPDQARVEGAMGRYDQQCLETQASAATNDFYMWESPSSWPLAMQPSMPIPIPYQFRQPPPFLMESPFLMPFSPPGTMDTEGDVPVQMPSVYQSRPFAAPCSQDPAGLWDQRCNRATEGPPVIQCSFPPGDIRDFSQEGGPDKTQKTDTMGDNGSYIQGQDPQERATLVIGNDNEEREENANEEKREKRVTAAVPAAAAAAAGDVEAKEKEEKEEKAATSDNTVHSLKRLQKLHLPEE